MNGRILKIERETERATKSIEHESPECIREMTQEITLVDLHDVTESLFLHILSAIVRAWLND
jgi:hypothetical protein